MNSRADRRRQRRAEAKRAGNATSEAQLLAARGCAASKDLALQCWMQDVTSLLCYQPEVPHAHKESLVKALDHYMKRCAELDEVKQHNDQAHPTAAGGTGGAQRK